MVGLLMNRGNVELVAFKTDIDGSPTQPKNAQSCQK